MGRLTGRRAGHKIRRMTARGARRWRPWLSAFVVSIACFAGSLGLLAAVLLDAVTGTETAITADPTPTPGHRLTYRGTIPAGLDTAGFEPAVNGTAADIEFLPVEAGGVPLRYYALVTGLAAGVDSLGMAQVQVLLGGGITDWSQVGGLALGTAFALAGPQADRAPARSFAGGATPVHEFETYAELRAAMAANPGIYAFVPLAEVDPSMSAIAVDGMDIVRGRGDPGAWPFAERVAVTAGTERGRAALEGIVAGLQVTLAPVTTVVATGDILQSRCTLARIEASGDWGYALRGATGEYLAAADLTLGSLDGSIQDINPVYRCVETTNLSSPPGVLEALRLAGFDGVTVATNHVFDCGIEYCGEKAFLRTLELLAEAGIKHVGGGHNLDEALSPAVFEVNGVRFGVLGFDDVAAMELEATPTAPGTAPLDDDYAEERRANEPAFFRPASELSLDRFAARIRNLKSEVDVVIVQVQTGTEDTHDPSGRSIKALRAAADAGADLVVGNQAHWVQAAEMRGGTFIAYALGNFIFDQRHSAEHEQGYLLEASFRGATLANVRLRPYRIVDQARPVLVTGEERAKILQDVFEAAARLTSAP
ncbi:MAG: hypothetical protein DYG91_00480 [Chloroflexi bacterium CFX7]|nr:hypothetical protein [Chloroflexi bacterium CFX7]